MAEDLIPATQPAFLSEWNFILTLSAPPTTAQARLNSNNQKNATRVWIHKITANGIDATAYLEVIKTGDTITLREDATKWQQYAISAAPIKQTDYWEYPVTWQAGGTISITATKITIDTPITAVSTNVTALPMQAASGAVTTIASVKVGIATPSMQAASGAATAITAVAADVTAPSMQMSSGTVTTIAAAHVGVTAPPMQTNAGSVVITGYILLPGQAYPSDTPAGFSPGMTLRQYYVGQAITGFLASGGPIGNLIGKGAAYCFQVADSMIEFEAKELGPPVFRLPPVPSAAPPQAPPPQSAPPTVPIEEALELQAQHLNAAE